MRTRQVERRRRTRHLVELGGLIVKSDIVDVARDDRATIIGAFPWMAGKLRSDDDERQNTLGRKGDRGFRDGKVGAHRERERGD